MDEEPEDRQVDVEEAARILCCKRNTLDKARCYGGAFSIRYAKTGSKVTYSTRDLRQFLLLNGRTNTAQRTGS